MRQKKEGEKKKSDEIMKFLREEVAGLPVEL